MKLLQVMESTLGGTGRHIIDLCRGLMEAGHEVHLAFSRRRSDQAFEQGLRELESSGLPFSSHEMSARRAVTPSDLAVMIRLQRYIREHGPFDVIHSHSTKAGFLARLLPRDPRSVAVYSPHALMTQDPSLAWWKRLPVCWLESLLMRRCDSFIAISAAERECAIHTGIPKDRISMVYNGLRHRVPSSREARVAARARLNMGDDELCVGSIGLMVENKEHSRLLDAFAAFQAQFAKPARLVLLGWGPMEEGLRRKAAALGIGDRVNLLGQVPAREYFAGFDILAHPSRYEGFANVFLESLDAGVPIVATNVGGAQECVLPGITGYICDPWDTDRFANCLLDLARNPDKRAAMGEAAQTHIQNFTADLMIERTLAVYQQCLAERDARRGSIRTALTQEAE